MKVVVTIQHAGHVHFFKHAIETLRERGHEVHVFARENELSTTLLECCDVEYELLAGDSDSLFSLARRQVTYEARLLGRAREIEPDVMTAIGGVAVSHVAALVGAKSVVFYDTEHASIITKLAYPFADVVCTPECYRGDIGDKQVTYPSYHELAYLHPNRFEPDPSVLEDLDADPDDPLVVLRFGDWSSSHDVGQSGFDDPAEVVDRLEAAGADLLVTAEGDVADALEPYQVSIAPERLHDLLYYADLYVGEGATTAAECAGLGTPAVYVNSLSLGYIAELDREYDLVVSCTGEGRHERAIETATQLLAAPDVAATWERRRQRMLEEKIDATAVVLREIDAAVQVEV